MLPAVDKPFGLDLNTTQKIWSVFGKYPQIEKALIYGSRAKGNFRPGSDIDLTLEGSKLDLATLLQVENDLDELLLPYKIDLSIYQQIENPDLVEHIRRVGQIFYESITQ